MPRSPRGKRTHSSDGARRVVAKNPNGEGSVYFEPPSRRPNGTTKPARWRATWVDHDGKTRRVSAKTRAEVEAKRDELAAAAYKLRPSRSNFGPKTTVAELIDWWLESVARHRVKASTFDSYKKFGSYLADDIGTWRVIDSGPEAITEWQSKLLDRYAPYTVLNCRKICRQAFDEAVKFGLIAINPFNLVKGPRAVAESNARALTPEEAKRLIGSAQDLRYGAVVTLLFCQGWRISEVLGLAWEDLDLDARTAHMRRGATYSPSTGTVLGTTKTSGAQGVHYLAPSSIDHLRRRQKEQENERERIGDDWPDHTYDGELIHPVFTTTAGKLVNRQYAVKTIHRAAKKAGIDLEGLATHTGRRTVVTALYANGGVDLADIARHVGHADTSTTAGYVRSLGERPAATAKRAAELLDPSL